MRQVAWYVSIALFAAIALVSPQAPYSLERPAKLPAATADRPIALQASGDAWIALPAARDAGAGPELVSKEPKLATLSLADSILMAAYSFDDSLGAPDQQGWTIVEPFANGNTYFHVDDFADLGGGAYGGLTALDGAQSLWLGRRPEPPCSIGTFPGYGDAWSQVFESVAFNTTGDVTLDCLLRYDTAGEDVLALEYLSKTGSWRTLDTYSGALNDVRVSHTVFADSLDASVKFRFRFASDLMGSDEGAAFPYDYSDGACIIDSLTVTDMGGVVDMQDFEGETFGATSTADGDWAGMVGPSLGDFAGLVDGDNVVQEDLGTFNSTNFWSFFNGSPDTYDCGGFPAQEAMPYTPRPGSPLASDYVLNEIWSPWIALTHDIDGDSVETIPNLMVRWDYYRDLPLDNLHGVVLKMRFKTPTCTEGWQSPGLLYIGEGKDWARYSYDVAPYIPAGATEIQVAFQAVDVCYVYCGLFGSGACHSHAPLIDNVDLVIDLTPPPLVVTSSADSGPGTLRQAILDANAAPGRDQIVFQVNSVTIKFPTPVVTDQLFIIGTGQTDGYPDVTILYNAAYASNGLVLAGSGGHLVRDIAVVNFTYNGIHIASSNNRIEDCWMEFNNRHGVMVQSGVNNSIRRTECRQNAWLGIDLNNDWVTQNDPNDADIGPNNRQNFPVITAVDLDTETISGTLHSTATTTFIIDLYFSSIVQDGENAYDPTGYGEGTIYLTSTTVATNGSGDGSFTASYTTPSWFVNLYGLPIGPGDVITATATDPDGNTSEFSASFHVPAVVTNTNTSGNGSLSRAVYGANLNPNLDTITFDIPGGGPHTIATPWNGLVVGGNGVLIDGYSQAGASPNTNPPGGPTNAVLMIEIDGSPVTASQPALYLYGDSTEVRGLAINNGGGAGIEIDATGCEITGCFIGTNVAGNAAEGNAGHGITVPESAGPNTIGGPNPEDVNLISGNGMAGVQTDDSTRVYGNLIGTDASGSMALPNGEGVRSDGFYNTIGDVVPGYGNVIAFNTGVGVYTAQQNSSIRGNSIHSNGGLGIDATPPGLSPPGWVTVDSVDVGTNEVLGTLTNDDFVPYFFTLDFYRNEMCDPSGYGEGGEHLGAEVVIVDGNSTAPYTFASPINLVAGDIITLTSTSGGNTVEFTPCLVAPNNTPMGMNVVVPVEDPETGETPVTVTFGDVAVGGNTTLEITSTGPPAPQGFMFGNTYFDLTTTAMFDSAEVCITYDEADLPGNEEDLLLFHYDDSTMVWEDITTVLDTTDNELCGLTLGFSMFTIAVENIASGIEEDTPSLPTSYALHQNAPNPFNPTTVIRYDVPAGGAVVELAIHDVTGRRIRTLVSRYEAAGSRAVTWDARNDRGDLVATGVYFYRLKAGAFVQTRKMVLLK